MTRIIKQVRVENLHYNYKERLISIANLFGKYEVTVLNNCGDELEMKTVDTVGEAHSLFDEYANKYLGAVQKSVYNAGMELGKKYTIAMLNDFGFPITIQIIPTSIEYTAYAQYDDAVHLVFKMKGRRKLFGKYLYNQSFAIFEGWQELPKDAWCNTTAENGVEIRTSKYYGFSHQYFEDMVQALKNPLIIHDDSKIGVDGRVYA